MDTKIVTVDYDSRSYDIFIGRSLLYRLADFVPMDLKNRAVFIVTDKNVQSYAEIVKNQTVQAGAGSAEILVLPPGEKTKSYSTVEKVCDWMLSQGISRDSIVFAVGGGVIGDLAGFCASIVMRGVPYVQIPTTLLSQVDSSVGGKTGINTAQGKNLVGSFYQPIAVIADTETLETLPKRELLAGYAEIVKYAFIQDQGFFKWLEQNGADVCALVHEPLKHAIETSCKAKAQIVEADERESGRRALLNFGHTFGHALEAAAGYNGSVLHGEAVAMGMVMAFDLSYRLGLCPLEHLELAENHLSAMSLPTRASTVDALQTSVSELMNFMAGDKKVVSGQMVFVVVNSIGDAFLNKDVPEDIVRAVLFDSLGSETKERKGLWTSVFSSLS